MVVVGMGVLMVTLVQHERVLENELDKMAARAEPHHKRHTHHGSRGRRGRHATSGLPHRPALALGEHNPGGGGLTGWISSMLGLGGGLRDGGAAAGDAYDPALAGFVPISVTQDEVTLCKLDFALQAAEPEHYPMFRDVVKASGCEHDASKTKSVRWGDLSRWPTTIEPTGFVFHQSRCGSTLVAGILASGQPSTPRL